MSRALLARIAKLELRAGESGRTKVFHRLWARPDMDAQQQAAAMIAAGKARCDHSRIPLRFIQATRSSAHNSVHRPEVEIGGTLANFSTVLGPFFDRFAEVEANEDARIRILGRRLGEACIRAEHW